MLGRFEEAVLLALMNATGEATIADIYEALADKLKRVSLGAIYTTLDRMIEKKFVTRRKGEALPERGGKARYYYAITSGGRHTCRNRSPEHNGSIVTRGRTGQFSMRSTTCVIHVKSIPVNSFLAYSA